jgi:hypothetical protein
MAFQPSGYKSPDGQLYFPTIKGLVKVDPENVKRNASPRVRRFDG